MPPFSNLLSKLTGGLFGGKGKPADHHDEVWLLDNLAFRRGPNEPWRAEYVAAFFDDNSKIREKVVKAIADLTQTLNLAPDDQISEDRIKDRLAPFVRQIGPNMSVKIEYEGVKKVIQLGPSDANGILSQELDVPLGGKGMQPGQALKMSVVHEQKESLSEGSHTAMLETGNTYFAADGGFGVISDIDDTIKVTQVRDRLALLKNTFVKEPKPVQGMPELYKRLHDALSTPSNPTPFVYLSASPYNLYPFLRSFIKNAGFPNGMMILRDMSWMAMESFVVSLTVGTQEYKEDRMKKVSTWLPKTTWVCIGDSTQTDPEAYATFYKQLEKNGQGGRVARIWIHKVVGVNPSAEKDLNDPKRFQKAFDGIDPKVWKVFENPDELLSEINALKQQAGSRVN